ncbi:MAG: hypothetical protein ABUL65_03730, partial [Opitutus sp.]
MRRAVLVLFCLLVPFCLLRAEVPPLLQEIAGRWLDERPQWSFTQLVRETSRDGEVHERLERFDLSRGYDQRWQLLAIDGRAPTAQEIEASSQRKNRGKPKSPRSWFEYVDLDNARLRGENDRFIRYEVPLKRVAGGLFPGDKISVLLTIDKQTHALEHAQARVDEPFNVALGLAEVVEVKGNVALPPAPDAGPVDNPSGSVSAVVNRLGKRVEYTWTDFRRTPARRGTWFCVGSALAPTSLVRSLHSSAIGLATAEAATLQPSHDLLRLS